MGVVQKFLSPLLGTALPVFAGDDLSSWQFKQTFFWFGDREDDVRRCV